MKIAVISDTHVPIAAADIPQEVYDGIKGVDLILHAGDIVEMSILDKLSKIAPVRAVCGNMDPDGTCEKLPKKDVIKVAGISIGLMHGWGAPSGLEELALKEFKKVDVIIFGHSHKALIKTVNGVLLFNPGSPTDRVYAPFNSYGMLEIENGKISPSIIKIS